MINLRKEIQSLLKSKASSVYYQDAPETASFPYVIFDFPNSFDNFGQDVYNLDIDIWDNKINTTDLEVLADTLWDSLNKYTHIDANIQFVIYRMNRLALKDNDPSIRRRKLIFQVRFLKRRVN